MRRALCPRKSRRFSFMLPYSREMMILDISLYCVVSQRPLFCTLDRLPRPIYLLFPYSGWVRIVLRRSKQSVVSDGHVFGLFVPLPPGFLIGFPRNQTFHWMRLWPNYFLSAVFVVFRSWYQSTLILVPPSIRPM